MPKRPLTHDMHRSKKQEFVERNRSLKKRLLEPMLTLPNKRRIIDDEDVQMNEVLDEIEMIGLCVMMERMEI